MEKHYPKIKEISDKFNYLECQAHPEVKQLMKVELLETLKTVRDDIVDWIEEIRLELADEFVEKWKTENEGRVAA